MSLGKKQGGVAYEVYPLELRRVQLGSRVIYDRDTRGKSWFILDLRDISEDFIPRGSSGMMTADGKRFRVIQKWEGD